MSGFTHPVTEFVLFDQTLPFSPIPEPLATPFSSHCFYEGNLWVFENKIKSLAPELRTDD